MDPIDILCNLSGQTRDQCMNIYEICGYDMDTAAIYLLDMPQGGDILPIEQSITAAPAPPPQPKISTPHSASAKETISTTDLINDINISEICARFHETQWHAEDLQHNQIPPEYSQDSYNIKILIPKYRLEEALEKLILPDIVQVNPIWDCDNIIPVPGGVTICEISSIHLDAIESFLALLTGHLARYEMSHCFIIDTITKRENRKEFLKQMDIILPNLFGIDSKELHRDFHDQAIFRCSVLHDDDVGTVESLNDSHSLASILTVTLSGLPEMILTIHEVIKNIASSFSNSKITGNGSLSCIPDEWSLRCHMLPYSLILLPEGGEEWNKVITLGRWDLKNPQSLIKCIHRVENIELWRGYCSKRDAVERSRGDANEKWYWHGTRHLSPEVIAKEGFDFRVANSGMYGRGAYFAHSVNYSANGYKYLIPQPPTPTHSLQSLAYDPTTPTRGMRRNRYQLNSPGHAYAQLNPGTPPVQPFPAIASPIPIFSPQRGPHQNPSNFQSVMEFPPGVGVGDSQLILARVCVGNTIVMAANQALTRPPDGYDSVTGQDTMTIVYDLALAYPSYIVTYR